MLTDTAVTKLSGAVWPSWRGIFLPLVVTRLVLCHIYQRAYGDFIIKRFSTLSFPNTVFYLKKSQKMQVLNILIPFWQCDYLLYSGIFQNRSNLLRRNKVLAWKLLGSPRKFKNKLKTFHRFLIAVSQGIPKLYKMVWFGLTWLGLEVYITVSKGKKRKKIEKEKKR